MDLVAVETSKPTSASLEASSARLVNDNDAHKMQQWTGKYPKTLLYEYVQRHKLSKPVFHTLSSDTGRGCRARCVVSDKKGKSENERIFETIEVDLRVLVLTLPSVL